MALGGLLAASDRRYRVRAGSEERRACGSARHEPARVLAAARHLRRRWWCCSRRPDAQSARGAVAARRQARAAVRAAAACASRDKRFAHEGHAGQGLAAERVGVVVRVVPRRASGAASSSRARRGAGRTASTTRTSARTAALARAATAIPTGSRSSTRDGRIGIDYGVYGVPETYVIDKRGVIRYKQIGPVTRESARAEDPAAGRPAVA